MKRPIWMNVLYSIFALGGITFAALFANLITAMLGGMIFYVPLVVTISVFLGIYAVAAIFGLPSARIRHIAIASFAGLCILVTAGYEINKGYHNSFAKIDEQEVNLHQYAPFEPESKAVALEQTASYHIDSQLPRLDGATALYPLYAAFVQAVYPSGKYNPYESEGQVVCTTTPDAYSRLITGETDIIFVAAPSPAQEKAARSNGVELKLTPIGREAFVFFVNKRNPVTGLTTEQIKDIYSGKLTNWQEVGGRNDHIRAFQRPEDSGSQTMLKKVMGGNPLMTPPQEDIADFMSGIISQTSSYRNYKNALGYSFLFYASEMNKGGDIALLDIDGVKPNKESIRSGQYPMAAPFYAVTAGSDNPHVQPFLDWILSAEGQELVEKTGYTSLK